MRGDVFSGQLREHILYQLVHTEATSFAKGVQKERNGFSV